MQSYDVIVIGFGKAGKTLAGKMAKQGKTVALIEQDQSMYGGTCINIGCIPTKTLINASENNLSFSEAMALKETVVSKLNQKNTKVLQGSGVDLINANAHFISDKVVQVRSGNETSELTAETIIINTGAVSNQFPIPGLADSKHVYDSTGIQKLDNLPERLGIIGGGNIGLEFANLYAKLGSKVTVFETAPMILGRSEESIAKMAKSYMEEDGISFQLNAKVENISNKGDEVVVHSKGEAFTFDTVMYAMGRKPATEGLGLENTAIQLTDKGAIQVNDVLETSVENVYAVGDVNGGLQFTYTSLDDSRIVYGQITGESDYKLSDRHNVPNSIFINPPLSQVGMTEKEAKEKDIAYKANELLVANMPRGHVNNDLRGIYKVLVSTEDNRILGASLFAKESHEVINLIKMAMDNQIPYSYLKNQVYTHPTMSENLNDVFNF